MNKKTIWIVVSVIAVLFITAGIYFAFSRNTGKIDQAAISTPLPSVTVSVTTEIKKTSTGLANPAAVYCQEQGGTSKIVTAADGSQSGQCEFPDGKKCDEWQFFRTKVCK